MADDDAKTFPSASATRTPDVSVNLKKRRQRGSRRYGRMNSFFGLVLLGLVLLSAVPVGSNRPAWWLVWSCILGLLGMVYVMRAQVLMGKNRSFQASQFGVFIALAMIVPIYAIFQFLPIAPFFPQELLNLPQVLPITMAPISISIMPEASLLGAVRALGFLVFLVLTIEVGTQPNRNHKWAFWLMVGLLLHAIFGILALKAFDDFSLWGIKQDYKGVLTGTFVNRNSVATFLGFGLVLALALALERGHKASFGRGGAAELLTRQRLEILGLWLAVMIFAVAIFLTQSRMGAFATGFGGYATFVAISIATKAGLRKIFMRTLIGLTVLFVVLIPIAGTALIERGLFTLIEVDVRLSIYSQTWAMIMDRPWTGFGYDAFAPAFELYRAPPLAEEQYIDLAHNTYLTLWAEQGLIIGSIPLILVCWAVLMIIGRLRHKEGDLALNGAALGVAALGALHSTADFSLEMPANVFCFLLILGLSVAPARNPDQAQLSQMGAGK